MSTRQVQALTRAALGDDAVRWPARWWLVLLACVATSVVVAVRATSDTTPDDPVARAAAQAALARISTIPQVAHRVSAGHYERTAFGAAWTDAVGVAGGRNGCDTRNDILRRDLTDTVVAVVSSCPRAVTSGEFRSPYTGRFITFRRDRRAGAVQIDHIVPLAFAWDMGAASWEPTRRVDFANDPANLVAVDAASNQDKSDQEPGRWMPPDERFHCRYAIQFVIMSSTYGLSLDRASARELTRALRRC